MAEWRPSAIRAPGFFERSLEVLFISTKMKYFYFPREKGKYLFWLNG